MIALSVAALGCDTLRAKSAFQDGNKAYKDENYKKAIESYQTAVKLDPTMAEAHFYLASAHQALFRPQKLNEADNRKHLDVALEGFKKALETNQAKSEAMKKLRQSTLAALVGLYSEDPYKNFDTALGYAKELVKDEPESLPNLFALGNLYERFTKI
ncbi:MAG: tetratricopeptide repeat protein, partial [Vicinamibacteria bacterium]|nr:tetratricopeptide repeat protein [Vicinamibacteria bacterium]